MSATGIKHYEGDYDDYLEAVNKELASTAGQDEQQVNSTAKPKNPALNSLTSKVRKLSEPGESFSDKLTS